MQAFYVFLVIILIIIIFLIIVFIKSIAERKKIKNSYSLIKGIKDSIEIKKNIKKNTG